MLNRSGNMHHAGPALARRRAAARA